MATSIPGTVHGVLNARILKWFAIPFSSGPHSVRDTKGILHAMMGSKKDRNGMDLTAVEDIKKRWQEYTEELYKKVSSRPR